MAGLCEGDNEPPGSLEASSRTKGRIRVLDVEDTESSMYDAFLTPQAQLHFLLYASRSYREIDRLSTSLMLAGNEFQSLGRAIVKEDEYEEVRWDGIVSIVSWRECVQIVVGRKEKVKRDDRYEGIEEFKISKRKRRIGRLYPLHASRLAVTPAVDEGSSESQGWKTNSRLGELNAQYISCSLDVLRDRKTKHRSFQGIGLHRLKWTLNKELLRYYGMLGGVVLSRSEAVAAANIGTRPRGSVSAAGRWGAVSDKYRANAGGDLPASPFHRDLLSV
ncbi:hypothetical protein ANN_14712 [Periplaneta americana]|uniref:Uncharacterized protein n=1 Tax=Periplaneta americana TaxID=6978 RepID=A0ABQ8SX47_PERAM|nr:hypothetical protein ANN_14712 [Periplaneta americana]